MIQYLYGLGGIESPPDPNDWPIDLLYASLAGDPIDASTLAAYTVPGTLPPIIDQGTTPECVAYSQSTLKAYEDLKDQGSFNFDEPLFFHRIGGNQNGAVVRTGLAQMLHVGYPVVGNPGSADLHKIAAYYSVPKSAAAIMSAIANFGIVTVLVRWKEGWFHPVNGVLPESHVEVGNHEIDIIGWDFRGAHLQNTWGTAYGEGGRVFLSWDQLIAALIEAWKTVDQIVRPPVLATYRAVIAAHATVQIATLKGSCIAKWTNRPWGPASSSAPCRAPEVRKGCSSGQASVVYVTKGVFVGQRIRIAAGVTVVRSA